MAPSVHRPVPSRRGPASDSLQECLARLTINLRPKQHSSRINKSTSSNLANGSTAYPKLRHEIWLEDPAFNVMPPYQRKSRVSLKPHEINNAQAIFDKLPMIPGMSNRTPRLLYDLGGRCFLEYPDRRRWSLFGREAWPNFGAHDIRSIWRVLLSDIQQLYDAHVAYDPNIKTLWVVKRQTGNTPMPFIDKFDYGRDINDNAASWEEAKQKAMETVNAQFNVLLRLVQLGETSPSYLNQVDIQPDSAVEVLEHISVREFELHQIIRDVKQFSPKLGEFVGKRIRGLIVTFPPRTGPAEESINDAVHHSFSTISHTLGLLDQYLVGKHIELDDLAGRATLWVLYATLLFHIHAKDITAVGGRGVLDLNNEPMPDFYTSYEGFQAVANSFSEVKNAIRHLEGAGGELDLPSRTTLVHPCGGSRFFDLEGRLIQEGTAKEDYLSVRGGVEYDHCGGWILGVK